VIATLFLLSMSFVFHMMARDWIARNVMLRLDTAAIFVLIASTFTVIHGVLFTDWRRWGIISLLWLTSIIGIAIRSVFYHDIPKIVGDLAFLAIGWMCRRFIPTPLWIEKIRALRLVPWQVLILGLVRGRESFAGTALRVLKHK